MLAAFISRYQPVTDFTYWTVLGSFINWNIIRLSPKSTPFEAFEEIHQVVLDGISDHMASLVKCGRYGAIKAHTDWIWKCIGVVYLKLVNLQLY